MRIAVYTDYAYHASDRGPRSERAFSLFIAELARHLERVVVLGRLHPSRSGGRYDLGPVTYKPLPYYPALTTPLPAIRGMLRSLRPLWRSLDEVDCVWVLGPHPLGIAYCLMAFVRGRRVVLGVRQDSRAYVRSRHPGRRVMHVAADALDLAFRALGRVAWGVIAVGPAIAARHRRSRRLLEISVSLVRSSELTTASPQRDASYDGELTVVSVGRLEPEKNPLALADALAELRRSDGGARWRLVVCGEGRMREDLERRLDELGLAGSVEFAGYVPHDQGLDRIYREAHALLHMSWTEGVPQVLFEAFGARLPVVATDVGGVREVAGGAALLIQPGDPAAAAEALRRIAADPQLRERLVAAGVERLRHRTLDSEGERVAEFLRGPR